MWIKNSANKRGNERNRYLYCHEPTYPKVQPTRLEVDS